MKKFMNFALAGVLGVTALASAVSVANPAFGNKGETPNASASKTTSSPKLAITEISADPMQMEFASLDTAKPDAVVRDTSDMFEFVEIHNYSDVAVNLKNYALQHVVDNKTYQNAFLFEDANDGILEAGETWVIFNYTTASASYGSVSGTTYSMRHDTEEDLTDAWVKFNEFYGISVPVTNRVMALAANSDGTTISGASALATKGNCEVSIVKTADGAVETKIEYTVASKGLSHNFVYTDMSGVGELLCVNGVSPYRLLREQDPTYSRSYDFSGEKLRLVSYNLLFTGYVFSARASCFTDFLTTYSPDVVTLQEIATEWYDYLHVILPTLGYTYIEVTVQTGGTVPTYASDSSNPIIYKTDKFDLIETGGTFVSETGERGGAKWDSVNRDRTINYAVLQSKETGNTFNVLSTHGILTGDIAKLEHANMAKNLADEISAKYNCPSFITGDMNMDEGSKYYQNFVNGTGYFDSKYLAMNSTYRLTCAVFGRCPYGVTDKVNPWNQEPCTIDYIFVPENTQIKTYSVIDQAYYNEEFSAEYSTRDCHISDHSAVLADIYL